MMDDIQLPVYAKEILGKGPAYAICKNPSIVDDIPVVEQLISEQNELEKEQLR